MKKGKGQLSKAKGGYSNSNTLQMLSLPTVEFVKCPVNIGESLKWNSEKKAWMDFRLYLKYLDLKAQNPNAGTFKIYQKDAKKYYERTIKSLVAKGWAAKKGRIVLLKAYQYVWRDLGINRIETKDKRHFKYWKIYVSNFSTSRTEYLKELREEIYKRIAKRKLAQFRRALKEKGVFSNEATFSARSAGSTFGYRSPSTGSKLRDKYFEVIQLSPEESKPKYNPKKGRFEEPTKRIVI